MNITVKTDKAYIQGRNGCFDIAAIDIWGGDKIPGYEETGLVHIDGVGKRGYAINGGFGRILPEEMDQLCIAYLRERGLWKE